MTFAATSDRYGGERPVTLVEITDGSTTFYWSTDEVRDDTNGIEYGPRITRIGSVDRTASTGAGGNSDLSFTLSNLDGGIDSFVEDFGTFSYLKATATIKVGFASLAIASFETVATMGVWRVQGLTGGREIRVELVDSTDRLFGSVNLRNLNTVMSLLNDSDGTQWPIAPLIGAATTQVPIVLGAYDFNTDPAAPESGVDVAPAGILHSQTLGGQTFTGIARVVAISPVSGFNTTGIRIRLLDDDGNYSPHQTFDPFDLSSATTEDLTWDEESLAGGWYALIVKMNIRHPAATKNAWRVSCRPWPPGAVGPGEWSVAEFVRGVAQASTGTAWASAADTASWSTVDNSGSVPRLRKVVYEDTDANDLIAEATKQADLPVYLNKAGKLAALWVEPTAGGSPDYSGNFQIAEGEDVLVLEAQTQAEGYFAPMNRAAAKWASWREKGELETVSAADSSALSRHGGKIRTITVGGDLFYEPTSARSQAERSLALRVDPRWVLQIDLPWRAAQLELGDVVEVDHTAIPGWSTDRACVVWGVSYDLQNHRATATVIDYDSYLRGKVFVYNSEDNWTVAKNTGGGTDTATLTASSASITMSGIADGWDNALQDDVIQFETDTNQWQGLIDSIDTDPEGGYHIVIRSGGGEDGPTLADIANESGAKWRILRGYSNRDTTGGLYTALAEKYGSWAGADGFFRDDSTAAYTYQR